MREALRQALVDVGIPASDHDLHELARWFPPELRLDLSRLDASMAAELLLAFVRSGVLSVTRAADPAAIARRAPGAHLCHFYRHRDEILALVSAFFAEGFAAGEQGVWALPPWLSTADAEAALVAFGLGPALADGRLRLAMHADVYVGTDGALRPAGELRDAWKALETAALAAGFAGVRVCGDGTHWHRDAVQWRAFLDYEQTLEPMVAASRLVVLCTFAMTDVPARDLTEALLCHDCGVVRRYGAWDEIPATPGAAAALRLLTGENA